MLTDRDILLRKAEAVIILKKREARATFWAFCLFYDFSFFSKRMFLKKIADAFQLVYEHFSNKLSYRLAVSLPPRAGKSYISSLFIAWMMGHYPQESVMRNTCSSTLYNKLSYDTRDIVRSKKFKEIFENVNLQPDKQSVAGWNLTESKQVGYFGGGVGSTIIGFGASMLAMTDDLYKSLEEAMSDTTNESIWSWKQGTHDSRLEGNCCCIDIGTRWSETDVLGRMEAAGRYDDIIRIPALDENDKSFCEDVHTTEYYLELRDETDDTIWSAEYQQEPIEAKGLLFPKSDLLRYRISDIAGKEPAGIVGACDVADKGDDDFAAPFGKVFDDKIFISDVLFTKDPVEVTQPRLAQMIIDTKCNIIRIESNNGGRIFSIAVKKDVKETNDKQATILGKSQCEIQARPTTKNKETRILMKSGFIKKHFVFLHESEYKVGSDYFRFMKGLTSYKREGENTHDDAPDCVTILAELIESVGLDFKKNTGRKVAKSTGAR